MRKSTVFKYSSQKWFLLAMLLECLTFVSSSWAQDDNSKTKTAQKFDTLVQISSTRLTPETQEANITSLAHGLYEFNEAELKLFFRTFAGPASSANVHKKLPKNALVLATSADFFSELTGIVKDQNLSFKIETIDLANVFFRRRLAGSSEDLQIITMNLEELQKINDQQDLENQLVSKHESQRPFSYGDEFPDWLQGKNVEFFLALESVEKAGKAKRAKKGNAEIVRQLQRQLNKQAKFDRRIQKLDRLIPIDTWVEKMRKLRKRFVKR